MMKNVISNTEVQTFLLCEKQHDFRFSRNLEPKPHILSTPLRRGLMGHVALEEYYTVLQQGGSVEEALEAALNSVRTQLDTFLTDYIEDDIIVGVASELMELLKLYADFYRNDDFEILAIEKVYTTSVDDSTDYGLKLDLLALMKSGPYKGEILIIDHKFLYNFKTQKELDMNIQAPKYINTLRWNDVPVRGAIFNQIRHRKMDRSDLTKVFRRDPCFPKSGRIKTVWEEQQRAAKKIAAKNGTPALRNFSDLVCPYCPFYEPCYNEMEGNPIDTILKINYRPSEYGYGKYTSLATGE